MPRVDPSRNSAPSDTAPLGYLPPEILALENRRVVEQHVDEAAWLWLTREHLAIAPDVDLRALRRFDDRLCGHLAGIAASPDLACELAAQSLSPDRGATVFVGAFAAFVSFDETFARRIALTVMGAPGCAFAAGSALAWLPTDTSIHWQSRLLAAPTAALKLAGLIGAQLRSEETGEGLDRFFHAGEPQLRAQICRVAAQKRRRDWLSLVERLLSRDERDPDVRFESARASLMLGGEAGVQELQACAADAARTAIARKAAETLSRCMPPDRARQWIRDYGRSGGDLRMLIAAMGAHGDPSAVPWLIRHTHDERVSRIAGEALCMITGVDLRVEDLDRAPESENSDVGGDERATPVAQEDARLPLPDPDRIEAWWREKAASYKAGCRYVAGHECTEPGMVLALRNGTQRQRMAAALEHGRWLPPGRPQFDACAPATRQVNQLRAWTL